MPSTTTLDELDLNTNSVGKAIDGVSGSLGVSSPLSPDPWPTLVLKLCVPSALIAKSNNSNWIFFSLPFKRIITEFNASTFEVTLEILIVEIT